MTVQLFDRCGNAHAVAADKVVDGKATVWVVDPCTRCGGAGGWQGWPGFTCYRCGGNCKEAPRAVKLYDAELTAKLDARAAKKRAKANADYQAAVAKEEALKAARREALAANELYVRAEAFCNDDFVASLLDQWAVKDLTDKQMAALAKTIDAKEERAVKAAASGWVGEVGDRMEFEGEVAMTSSFLTEGFGYGNNQVTCYVTKVDCGGNMIVYMGNNKLGEKGQTIKFKATVKAHKEYKGAKETAVSRPKVA